MVGTRQMAASLISDLHYKVGLTVCEHKVKNMTSSKAKAFLFDHVDTNESQRWSRLSFLPSWVPDL